MPPVVVSMMSSSSSVAAQPAASALNPPPPGEEEEEDLLPPPGETESLAQLTPETGLLVPPPELQTIIGKLSPYRYWYLKDSQYSTVLYVISVLV
jgi:hypothetical protein